MQDTWKKAQEWEREWHGNCINSFHEEEKQLVYAEKMGLIRTPTPKTPYNFDLEGKSILDIGGGAYSILLKCVNFSGDTSIIDPLMDKYPNWVRARYDTLGIGYLGCMGGEDILTYETGDGVKLFEPAQFDEVWIYNVLEHVIDPKKIIDNALELGKVLRIFEWVETRTNIGHPHSLKKTELDAWLGGEGKVEEIDHDGAVGKCYYGIFKGNHYGD